MKANGRSVFRRCKPFPWIRYVKVNDSFFLFDPHRGRYFTLNDDAARFWESLTELESSFQDAFGVQDLAGAFSEYELVQVDPELPPEMRVDISTVHGLQEHREFNHLILEFPEIDAPLMGKPLYVDLPLSNQRTLLEKFQVGRFAEGLIKEAVEFADAHEMIHFDIQLGVALVRVYVPEADLRLNIPLSQGFIAPNSGTRRAPDFSIYMFDDRSNARRTELDFPPDWHFPLGTLSQDRAPDYRVSVDRHTQTVSAFSIKSGVCAVWIHNYEELPYWSAATPFRIQLSWMADTLGWEFLHAAAIVSSNRAVLLGGPSGSGKSTLALRLAQLGAPLIADDYLLASGSQVQAIYRRLKVHDWSAKKVLPSEWTILNPHEMNEKRIVDPGGDIHTETTPIAAVIVPKLGGAVLLSELDSRSAISAIAPASLSGLLGGNQESLNRIAHLVQVNPCFSLSCNEDFLRDPKALESCLSRATKTSDNS